MSRQSLTPILMQNQNEKAGRRAHRCMNGADAVSAGSQRARLAELEAEIDCQEMLLARLTEADVVALHPATIAVYLDAVEQLAKALSASDAKAACLKLRELIDCIVVAPRLAIRSISRCGRLAAHPDPGKVSVRAWCPGRESYATTDTTNRCLSLIWWRERPQDRGRKLQRPRNPPPTFRQQLAR